MPHPLKKENTKAARYDTLVGDMLELSILDLQNGTLHMLKDFALPETGLKHALSDVNAIMTTCYHDQLQPSQVRS